jgi:acetyltransferase-like isoleucine patch superfamily enzyme
MIRNRLRNPRARALLQRGFNWLEDLRAETLEIRAGDPLALRFAEFGAGSVVAPPRVALINPGSVAIGTNVEIRSHICIEALAPRGHVVLRLGDGVVIGHYARLVALNGIEIGRNCGIGHGATVADSIHDWPRIFEGQPPAETPIRSGPPLRIEEGAWIGNDCAVLGGITIGARAIIAPSSVVTRDVPPQTMVSGNPGRRVPYPAS